MPTTNLDKFYAIQRIMDEFNGLSEDYLKSLEERYEYMNEYRREYRTLVRAVNDIEKRLETTKTDDEEIEVLKKNVRINAQRQIESIEEQREVNPYYDSKNSENSLNSLINALYRKVDISYLEGVQKNLEKHRVKIDGLQLLMETLEDYEKHDNREQKQKILSLIDMAKSDYLGSFKAYRIALETGEVGESFNDIFKVLAQLGYEEEAGLMADALPDYEDVRRERPNPQELLGVLPPVKSADLQYWQSNRRKSEGYALNMLFAKEVAYTRRALLEDREYIGTRNAFKRLNSAYDELSTYMYERYHELGGTPYNYHGHMDR
ncbi:hypothetical protein [Staphylococcus caprae]|uniref:hypothetical protein n=1 Tax=Staphylococcus caprae TaxID=29380 RepID=UPI0014511215|nr:hypothetical protein [Staphylococcus caprae]QJE26612.1 hypothetical protein HHJ99_12645 [Staphylococcus caprae]QJE26613.1 hypothetical protein HHJ99_12650 [Staphylococcus caprae]